MPSIPFNSETLVRAYLQLHPDNFSGTDALTASTLRDHIDQIKSAKIGKQEIRIPTDICRRAECLVPGIFSGE